MEQYMHIFYVEIGLSIFLNISWTYEDEQNVHRLEISYDDVISAFDDFF